MVDKNLHAPLLGPFFVPLITVSYFTLSWVLFKTGFDELIPIQISFGYKASVYLAHSQSLSVFLVSGSVIIFSVSDSICVSGLDCVLVLVNSVQIISLIVWWLVWKIFIHLKKWILGVQVFDYLALIPPIHSV